MLKNKLPHTVHFDRSLQDSSSVDRFSSVNSSSHRIVSFLPTISTVKDHNYSDNHSNVVQNQCFSTKNTNFLSPFNNMELYNPGLTLDFLDFENGNNSGVFQTPFSGNNFRSVTENKNFSPEKHIVGLRETEEPLHYVNNFSAPTLGSPQTLERVDSPKNKLSPFYISDIMKDNEIKISRKRSKSHVRLINSAIKTDEIREEQQQTDLHSLTQRSNIELLDDDDDDDREPTNAKKKIKYDTPKEEERSHLDPMTLNCIDKSASNAIKCRNNKKRILKSKHTSHFPRRITLDSNENTLNFTPNLELTSSLQNSQEAVRPILSENKIDKIDMYKECVDNERLQYEVTTVNNIINSSDKVLSSVGKTAISQEDRISEARNFNHDQTSNTFVSNIKTAEDSSKKWLGSFDQSQINENCSLEKEEEVIFENSCNGNCPSNMAVEDTDIQGDLTTINTIELYNCTQNPSLLSVDTANKAQSKYSHRSYKSKRKSKISCKKKIFLSVAEEKLELEEKMEVDSSIGDEKMDISEDSEDRVPKAPSLDIDTDFWIPKNREEELTNEQMEDYSESNNEEMEELEEGRREQTVERDKDDDQSTELRLRPRKFRSCFLIKERRSRALLKQRGRVLGRWFVKHFAHPYPSKVEKDELAKETNMSRNQVSEWFGNMRRRIREASRGHQMTWEERVRNYNDFISGKSDPLPILPGDILSFKATDKESSAESLDNLENSNSSLSPKFKRKLLQRYMSNVNEDSVNNNNNESLTETNPRQTVRTIINLTNTKEENCHPKIQASQNVQFLKCGTPTLVKNYTTWKSTNINDVNKNPEYKRKTYDVFANVIRPSNTTLDLRISNRKALKFVGINTAGATSDLWLDNLGLVQTNKVHCSPIKRHITPYSYIGLVDNKEKSKDRSSDEIAAAYSLMALQTM